MLLLKALMDKVERIQQDVYKLASPTAFASQRGIGCDGEGGQRAPRDQNAQRQPNNYMNKAMRTRPEKQSVTTIGNSNPSTRLACW